jgi:TPR repeat protein
MSWICSKCETENSDKLIICEVCNTPHYPENRENLVDNKEIMWRRKAISYNNQITKLDYLISKYNSKYYEEVIKYAPYLLISADSGEQEAQCMLGELFFSHDNNAYKNNAFVWFARAANQGNGKAMTLLALCYEKGYGTKENIVEAQKWYDRSINKGSDIADVAQQGLARMKKKRIMLGWG